MAAPMPLTKERPFAEMPEITELDREAKLGLRVLVIDDERTLRESCRSFLGSEGYNVEVCGKGDEALELLTRRPYDIVLIDQYMSDVPGAKLLDACLTKNSDTIGHNTKYDLFGNDVGFNKQIPAGYVEKIEPFKK